MALDWDRISGVLREHKEVHGTAQLGNQKEMKEVCNNSIKIQRNMNIELALCACLLWAQLLEACSSPSSCAVPFKIRLIL